MQFREPVISPTVLARLFFKPASLVTVLFVPDGRAETNSPIRRITLMKQRSRTRPDVHTLSIVFPLGAGISTNRRGSIRSETIARYYTNGIDFEEPSGGLVTSSQPLQS